MGDLFNLTTGTAPRADTGSDTDTRITGGHNIADTSADADTNTGANSNAGAASS